MHEQAQLRFKKDEVEKLGAEVYVVLAMDLYRTKVFKEENLVLSTFQNPFTKEPSLVFGAARGFAKMSARVGLGRKRPLLVCHRPQGNADVRLSPEFLKRDFLREGY